MAIIKWDPFFNDFDNFFDEDIVPFFPALKVNEAPVDIYEKDGKVYVEMPLSGYKPEDINIEAEENRLKISGKVEKKEKEQGKNYYRREIRKGSFEKLITLPAGIDAEQGEAEFEDGLLKIAFPLRQEEKKVKKIKVRKK